MRQPQVARRASVSVDAIRFYERRGILPRPEGRPSGYRVYRRADIDRVRMTKALQKVGFTLDEVIGALAAFDTGTATCRDERWRLKTEGGSPRVIRASAASRRTWLIPPL